MQKKKWPNRPKKKKELRQKITKSPRFLLAQLKQHEQFKRILFAIGSSLLIGLIFGMITLKMLKQEDPEQATILHTSAGGSEEEQKVQERTIAPVGMFVIQGGVFNAKENAQNFGSSFENLNFPVVPWERDDSYHLFAGIHKSEGSANELAAEMDEQGLDAFVKDWETKEGKLSMADSDYEWLQAFLEVWDTSLSALDSGEELPKDAWERLLAASGNLSASMTGILEEIERHVEKIGEDHAQDRYFLLRSIYEYENLLDN